LSTILIILLTVSFAYAAPLKKGDSGDSVRSMQQRLVVKGYLPSNGVDGKFGRQTENALKDFQKYNGLVVSGVLDENTRNKLFGTTSSSSSNNVYKKGDSNSTVTKIQQKLIAYGYLGEQYATGYYGNLTYNAIVEFQKKNGLKADGICGPQTYNKLFSSTAVKNTAANSTNTSSKSQVALSFGTLRKGSTGNAVVQLQQRLIAKGYMQGDATGYYGNVTFEAVKRFQRANNLTIDGICGPQTVSILFSGSESEGSIDLTGCGKMQMGDYGQSVKKLQLALKSLGYFTGDATGYFGEVTRAAVIKFQRENALYADGIVGDKTLAALKSPNPARPAYSSNIDVEGATFTDEQM
ncbi:MAG TPA: peptidoglycan-binding protein, partial [Clostridia bacterium]|nr:peptidoglycan-binding protein [Clostridia bacterium]